MSTETSKPQLLATWDSQPAATQCYVIALFFEKLLPSVRNKLANAHPALKPEYYRGRPVGWASKLIANTFTQVLQTQPAEWQIFCDLVSQLYPGAVVQQSQPVKQDAPDWLTELPQTLQIRLLAHGVAWQNLPSEDYPELRAKYMLSESDLVVIRFAAVTLQQMLDDGLLALPPSVTPPTPVAPVTGKLGTVPELVDFPETLPTVSVLAVLRKWLRDLQCKQIDVTKLLYKRPYTLTELKLYPECLNESHGSLLLRLLKNMVTQPTQAELRSADLLTAIAGFQVNGDDLASSEAVKFIAGIKASPEFQKLAKRNDGKVASAQEFEPEDTVA